MKTGRSRFYEILSAAIDDLVEHGFDSQERLDQWLRQIETAARQLLVPQSVLENALRDALQRVYARTTTTAHLLKTHQGIARYTLEMVKPKLRLELDRRILASASLIKLNREASIQRTLQRFAGWATSIPIGGTEVAERREVAVEVRRSIAGLPFEERRVIIDQGHKLSSAINEIVSVDGGAIAGRWRHVMEGGGYQARPEHVARNNKIYLLRESWAKQQGLVKPGPEGYTDEITAPGEEVYCRCVPGSTRIPFANVQKVYRRPYDAILYEIRTASGKSLRLTANHPVLTRDGWRSADTLNVGDDVIESIDEVVQSSSLDENEDNSIPTISEIFEFLLPTSRVHKAIGASDQFHGDGISDSDVDVVSTDRTLRLNGKGGFAQGIDEFGFANTDAAPFTPRALLQHGRGFWFTAMNARGHLAELASGVLSLFAVPAYVGGLGLASRGDASFLESQINRRLGRAITFAQGLRRDAALVTGDDLVRGQIEMFAKKKSSLGFVADEDASLLEATADSRIGHFEALCKFHGIDSGTVRLGQIIDVKRSLFSGHVYNLQTEDGWYSAEGIITHNCTYSYLYNLRDLPPAMLTEKGRDELARVREQIARMR